LQGLKAIFQKIEYAKKEHTFKKNSPTIVILRTRQDMKHASYRVIPLRYAQKIIPNKFYF